MTGRIVTLSMGDAPGSIRADTGVTVEFRLSEVALRDASDLAVGQLVTFEIEKSNPPEACNIAVEKRHYTSHETDKRQRAIRYMGFEQAGNVRAYIFERLSPAGGEVERAIVSAELSLFRRHAVGIQEGPTLCLRLVIAELDSSDVPFRRLLTDRDMVHHLASRPVREKKGGVRRAGVGTSHAANHVWRGTGPRTSP